MSDRVTVWVVSPHESSEYDEWWGPCVTDKDHHDACDYAQERLAQLWDQYNPEEMRVATVTIEQREVGIDEVPEDCDVEWEAKP